MNSGLSVTKLRKLTNTISISPTATKLGAIVGGQTSCKAPEIAAFEKHLPEDVEIVSCHSLHGPNVDPSGQPLVRLPRIIPLSRGARLIHE